MAGIYLHIPFCKQKCYYCDFHFSVSMRNKDAMISAILKELELRKNEIYTPVETIYFGGGTPSVLGVSEIENVLEKIYYHYDIVDEVEITLEANPDDLDINKLKDLSHTNINRLSIGIQSFFDDDLKYMNRSHTAKNAIDAINNSLNIFENISIDLIYGIPHIPIEKWNQNLQKAFSFNVPHISAYALTVEKNTALNNFIKKGRYKPMNDALALKHFKLLINESQKNNFVQYEISNFAKKDFFSKHNTAYWTGKPYLGIGPSAHSFNGKYRSWNISNNSKYIKSIQQNKLAIERELLSKSDHYNEFIMTNLRTVWGVSLDLILQKYGNNFKKLLLKNAQKHIENNTLKLKNNRLNVTDKGKFLCDGISSDLFIIEKS